MLQQKHDSQDVIDRKWKVSAVVGLSIRAGQISSGQQHLTDVRASIYVNCFWFLMLIWQFLLNPLLSKHGFCQTKRNESCQCGVKILCLRSVIARFFGYLADVEADSLFAPSHWLQTTELKCEGWNQTSKSSVPAERLSEQNIWLDEVIKTVSEPKFLQWTAAGCWATEGDGQEKRNLNARSQIEPEEEVEDLQGSGFPLDLSPQSQ